MKCTQDIKFDIMDKIGEDLTKGGLFSYGPTRDTLLYQGSQEDAVKAIVDAINGQYRETIASYQKVGLNFEVKIMPSTELAQKYLDRYNQTNPVVPFSEEQTERGYNLDNTGPNTDRFFDYAPAAQNNPPVGVLGQFIRHKERLASLIEARLGEINKELANPKTETARRIELNKLKTKAKIRLEGDINRGVKGLREEIGDLQRMANIDAVGYYVEQDLKRLQALTTSNNAIDLKEAQALIEFYDRAGTFQSDRDNPFFPQDQMFFYTPTGQQLPDYALGQATMDQFKQWRDIAMGFAPAIDLKLREVTTAQFNQNPGIQKIYNGKDFSFDEIVHTQDGLKDVDWVSAWAMDVTQNIFSKSAELGQVMHSILTNSVERNKNYSRDYARRMDELSPEVVKILKTIEGGKYAFNAFGIKGLAGVSYDLFLDATKSGMKTGTLVQRFTKEFTDAQMKAYKEFQEAYDKARAADPALQAGLYNSAYQTKKSWIRANTIIMNPSLVSEIISEPEFAEFKGTATQAEIDAHKKELVDLLGQRGYEEEVKRQKGLLREFIAEKKSYIETQIEFEGVADEASLSPKTQFAIKMWDYRHNPMIGVEDYYAVQGVWRDKKKVHNYMNYNNLIPRKQGVAINASGKQFTFTNTGEDKGYYNAKFKTIEDNPTLQKFHALVQEGIEKIQESAPYELQQNMAANTLPMLMKTMSEFLADNQNGVLKTISAAFRMWWDRLRQGYGLVQQSEVSTAVKDPITGKYNYKVNDSFLQGNKRAIQERSVIEKVKFIQAFNIGRDKMAHLKEIKRFTKIKLSEFNPQALAHLAQLLNVDIKMSEINAGKIDKIKALTGDVVDIGKVIRDFSVHTAVQAQSFDLPRLMNYFTDLAGAYAARTEVLPVMEIMKKHYEQIQNPRTTNTGNPIIDAIKKRIQSEGDRKLAIQQMEDWFQRVMLNNYGIKHTGVFGAATKTEVDQQTGKVTTKIPTIGRTIYSDEEKEKIREIDELLSKGVSQEEENRLNAIKNGFGKVRTVSAAVDNFMDGLRLLRLGWNLASGVTNLAEGVVSNMILAATGEFFEQNEIYYGYNIARQSWVKNLTFGLRASADARKARALMDRYNVAMDSKNELQKSTTRKSLVKKLDRLTAYELNARIEYLNQMPLMVAMLRSTYITGKDGTKSKVWDAMDSDGNLTDNFNTEENVNNWEKLSEQQYLSFKDKLSDAIVRGHGNYDELRGMMAKSNLAGKAVMMFKTWLPMQLYWRYAPEQINTKSGQKVKGRYRSFTPGTGALFAGALGFASLGPIGLGLGAVGFGVAFFAGAKTEVGAIKEMVYGTQMLFKKALGMPVNMISNSIPGVRRSLIDSSSDFDKWVGQGTFTELDAKNLRGNMSELAMAMWFLGLMLMAKSFFWDDDDDKDDARRQIHNIAVNKLMQLGSQASSYVSLPGMWENTFGSIAILKFLEDCGKEMDKLGDLFRGNDPGGTKVMRQTKKMFLPGIFKDFKLGFGTQAEKQFEPTPFDDWFRGETVLIERREKAERKNLNQELKDAGYGEKQRLKILNMEMPTTKQLNKKGYTREEWEAEMRDWERPEVEQEEEEQ